jgi:hypothetical protein
VTELPLPDPPLPEPPLPPLDPEPPLLPVDPDPPAEPPLEPLDPELAPEDPEPPVLPLVLAVAAVVPLLPFDVVVAPPQEIKPRASTSTPTKEVNAAGETGRPRTIPSLKPRYAWRLPLFREERFFASLRMTASAKSARAKRARAAVTSGNSREIVCGQFPLGRGMMDTAGGAATFTVSVEVALPFAATPTCGGLKLQVVAEGGTEQASVNCPEKPPVELSATAKFAEVPAATVALEGDMELTIPPTLNCTIWVCVISPLAALTVTG